MSKCLGLDRLYPAIYPRNGWCHQNLEGQVRLVSFLSGQSIPTTVISYQTPPVYGPKYMISSPKHSFFGHGGSSIWVDPRLSHDMPSRFQLHPIKNIPFFLPPIICDFTSVFFIIPLYFTTIIPLFYHYSTTIGMWLWHIMTTLS